MAKICTSFKKYVISNFAERLNTDAINLLKDTIAERKGAEIDSANDIKLNGKWIGILGIDEYVYFKLRWFCNIANDPHQYTIFTSYRVSLIEESFRLEQVPMAESDNQVYLNEFLIPYMNFSNLDQVATEVLQRVYGDDLPEDGIIKPREFAHKLQLSVIDNEVAGWNENVMGAIIFDPTVFRIKDECLNSLFHTVTINSGTIIINSKAKHERGLGSANNTIIHECIHWMFHWRLPRFYHLQDQQQELRIICSSVGDLDDDNAIKIVEKQANLLAPRILMPLYPFIENTQTRFHSYKDIRDGLRTDQYYHDEGNLLDVDLVDQYLIPSLTTMYKVSTLSVKIRLIETGFAMARGTRIYMDGAYLRPFSFIPGALSYKETYTISSADYNELLLKDAEFRSQLETGAYVFVENHVVLNSRAVVQRSTNKLILTENARQNLHLYALKFSIKRKGALYPDGSAEISCLLRLPTVAVEESLLFNPNNNPAVIRQAEEKKQAWMDFYTNQPKAWDVTLKAIIKEQELTIAKVAQICGMNYDTLQRYLAAKEDHLITKSAFTAVCIAVGIPYCVSKRLIQDIGYLYFDESNLEDRAFMQLLTGYIGRKMPDCNEFLISCDLKPFSDARNQKEEKKENRNNYNKRRIDFSSYIRS